VKVRMAELARSIAGLLMYRGVAGPEALETDFESYALGGDRPIGRNTTFENVVSHFGVSVYSDVASLLAARASEWVAELDPDQARGVLSVKTRRDPAHHDLLGDRRDMLRGVKRVFRPT
jgi:hypothetical protein